METRTTTRIREQNATGTLAEIADSENQTRDRIAIDTADGRTLVISAGAGRVNVTDETRKS